MSQLSLLVFVHVGLMGFCVGGGAVGGGDGCFYLGGGGGGGTWLLYCVQGQGQ